MKPKTKHKLFKAACLPAAQRKTPRHLLPKHSQWDWLRVIELMDHDRSTIGNNPKAFA